LSRGAADAGDVFTADDHALPELADQWVTHGGVDLGLSGGAGEVRFVDQCP
jgi:hypothetical protein